MGAPVRYFRDHPDLNSLQDKAPLHLPHLPAQLRNANARWGCMGGNGDPPQSLSPPWPHRELTVPVWGAMKPRTSPGTGRSLRTPRRQRGERRGRGAAAGPVAEWTKHWSPKRGRVGSSPIWSFRALNTPHSGWIHQRLAHRRGSELVFPTET